MNRKLFFLLYGISTRNDKLKKAAVFLSKSAEVLFFSVYGLGGLIILLSGRYAMLLRYTVIPLSTLIYNTLLRRILGRPRPFMREDGVESLTKHKSSSSCPSNHAASAMVIAMSWYCIYPPAAAVLVIPAIFTGISRVMTGEHYPFDVMLGWIIGLTMGILGFIVR